MAPKIRWPTRLGIAALIEATFQLTPSPMRMNSGITVKGPRIHQVTPYASPDPTPPRRPLALSSTAKLPPMVALITR